MRGTKRREEEARHKMWSERYQESRVVLYFIGIFLSIPRFGRSSAAGIIRFPAETRIKMMTTTTTTG